MKGLEVCTCVLSAYGKRLINIIYSIIGRDSGVHFKELLVE